MHHRFRAARACPLKLGALATALLGLAPSACGTLVGFDDYEVDDQGGPATEWTRQFGSSADDLVDSLSVGANGDVVVAGRAYGVLPGPSATAGGVFVRKYEADGTQAWTRQFGAINQPYHSASVSVDPSGNVFVAGNDEPVPGASSSVGMFVSKYDSNGSELWIRRFGSGTVNSVSTDGKGNAIVAGRSSGELPGQSTSGATDAFVRKYAPDGTEAWTRQFGSSEYDTATSVSADTGNNVIVGGHTWGTLPGQSAIPGLGASFVKKYDPDGAELWTRQFFPELAPNDVYVSADGGQVLVTGFAFEPTSGDLRSFLRRYDALGSEVWTRYFGATFLIAASVTVARNRIFVAGFSNELEPGQTRTGGVDFFVKAFEADGTEAWTRQFGSGGNTSGAGRPVCVDGNGSVFVAGSVSEALTGQSSLGGDDAFVMKLSEKN